MKMIILCVAFPFWVVAVNMTVKELKVIPIVTAANDEYFPVTVVALTSLFENGQTQTFYEVYVMVPNNFKKESRKKCEISAKYGNGKIDFVEVGKKYKKISPKYYRLGIPGFFPHIKKCIYLDGDVIVRHDLTEMFDIKMDDFYVGGVIDNFTYSEEQAKVKARALGLPDLNYYVCSGVLIMNLENMRKDEVDSKFSKFLENPNQIKLLSSLIKEIFWFDQEIINLVCYGKILCLPMEFGLMINLRQYSPSYDDCEEKDPVIVHFNGDWKPWKWKYSEFSIFHKEWNYYALKTQFPKYQKMSSKRVKKQSNRRNRRFGKRMKKTFSKV